MTIFDQIEYNIFELEFIQEVQFSYRVFFGVSVYCYYCDLCQFKVQRNFYIIGDVFYCQFINLNV